MNIPANRMNLLACRERLALTEDGIDLLRTKREALVREFFRMVDTIMDSRDEMARNLKQAMLLSAIAKSFKGSHTFRAAALSAGRDIPIRIREINVWGIRIPEVWFQSLRRTPEARGMMPLDTSPHILEALEAYEELLERLLKNASHEIRLKRLGEEIRKVSRRINALEQSILPSMKSRVKNMMEFLQEREREDLFRLKHIKNRRARTVGR